MTEGEVLDRFLSRCLPRRTSATEASRFCALGQVFALGRGAVVPVSAASDHIIFLSCGATKLVAHASSGRDQIVGFHFPDELFVVPTGAAHAYSLTMLQDSALIAFEYWRFIKLAQNAPDVLGTVLESARNSLARSREKSISLGRKTALERLAAFLVSMAGRIGECGAGLIVVELPMSRSDIGASLGLTIETVSRQFTHLREQKLIETSGKSRVTIRDYSALRACAGYFENAA